MSVESVLNCWFSSEVHFQAKSGELADWRRSHRGRLAEVIVLNQFSRNLYRGTARAYENDLLAFELANETSADVVHLGLLIPEQTFLYMPLIHSESIAKQDTSIQLPNAEGLETSLHWAVRHRDVIRHFGRFPHRNKVVGRVSSASNSSF